MVKVTDATPIERTRGRAKERTKKERQHIKSTQTFANKFTHPKNLMAHPHRYKRTHARTKHFI